MTKENRTKALTADSTCIQEGFREFSSNGHHKALCSFSPLLLCIKALSHEDVELIRFEAIEHITEPLSVHMHPVLYVRKKGLASLDCFDELEEL
jgi:hypothetical protein